MRLTKHLHLDRFDGSKKSDKKPKIDQPIADPVDKKWLTTKGELPLVLLKLKKWDQCAGFKLGTLNTKSPEAGNWIQFQFKTRQVQSWISQSLATGATGDIQAALTMGEEVLKTVQELAERYKELDENGGTIGLLNKQVEGTVTKDSIATVQKQSGEWATIIHLFAETSTNPALQSIKQSCLDFSKGGHLYDRAKQDVEDGNYLDAKIKVEESNKQVADFLAIWKKAWDQEEIAAFKQRTADVNKVEAKLAKTLGEDNYLQKMLVINKIVENNKTDLAALKLSPEQAVAIFGYTTEDYNVLNPVLRGGKPPKHLEHLSTAEWQQVKQSYQTYIASTNEGLKNLPAVTGFVYRGTSLSALGGIKGDSFSDEAFISSSSTKAFTGPMQFIINSKGVGRDVSMLSLYPEGEVLFPSGTKFKVSTKVAVVDGKDADFGKKIANVVTDAKDRYPTFEALLAGTPTLVDHKGMLSKVLATAKVFVVMDAT